MIKIPAISLTPTQLDLQCQVSLDGWVDLDSPQARELDDDHTITIKWLRIGVEAGFMWIDTLGRIWGKGTESDYYYPYHFDTFGKKYGFRVSAQASN
jgi:hypothetical protein